MISCSHVPKGLRSMIRRHIFNNAFWSMGARRRGQKKALAPPPHGDSKLCPPPQGSFNA